MARALSFSLRDARAILDYDRTVFEQFVRQVRRLPGAQATRSRGIGHESLFNTLVHILNVHEVWHVYIVRGRNSDEELEKLFEDTSRKPKNWKAFDAYAARVWREVDATLASLTPRTLGRKVKAFWMPGSYTVRDAILQSTLEEAHHLGEIIGALWQDDIETDDMTWIDVGRKLERRTRRR